MVSITAALLAILSLPSAQPSAAFAASLDESRSRRIVPRQIHPGRHSTPRLPARPIGGWARSSSALSATTLPSLRAGASGPSRRSRNKAVGACLAALAAVAAASLADFSAIRSTVNGFYKSSPYAAAFLTCGTIASSADLIAQKFEAAQARPIAVDVEKPPVDLRRILAFLLYGGVYQGAIQEYLYNRLFPMIFGSGTGRATVLGKVAADMLILTPFTCLPSAYAVKALVFGRPLREAAARYIDDVTNKKLLFRFWGLWGPVQCLTFGIVPEHLRVTFISCVSFFWLIILSTISSKGSSSAAKQ